jgi:hypothetical protein
MAKIQMPYDMGRGAREANANSNKNELMNRKAKSKAEGEKSSLTAYFD